MTDKLGLYIKGPPAFIWTLAPLSTSELRPSETNWASVNKAACRDLAAPTKNCRALAGLEGSCSDRKIWSCCFPRDRCQLHRGGCWKKFSPLAEQEQRWGHFLLHLEEFIFQHESQHSSNTDMSPVYLAVMMREKCGECISGSSFFSTFEKV